MHGTGGRIFASVFSDYTRENMESQRRRSLAAFSGKIFQKTAKSKICSIPAAVPLALKWRLWYDYDMHHDMMRKREVHSVISYIRGPLEEKREDSVVVEAGNIGYRIFIPSSVLGELPGLGEEVKIYTYFSVREDGMSLFGFLSRQDLEMFRQLIGVNGVGPKSALGILSALKPDVLRLAVISGDAKAISKAPGVGAKTAQRIILDLKDKIKAEDVLFAGADLEESSKTDLSGMAEAGKEAVEALTALGYSASEAQTAVKKVAITEGMTSEDVLKGALKHLAFL